MKAYRIYHIKNGEQIYICNKPGYWLHVSADPEYAVPFLDKEKAEAAAKIAAKHVAPTGERYVEEYVENRKLIRFISSGHVILSEMLSNFTHSNDIYELIA